MLSRFRPSRALRAAAAALALLSLPALATAPRAETVQAAAVAAVPAPPGVGGTASMRAPERLRLDYGIHLGGIRALTARLDLALAPTGYGIDLDIQPVGLFRALAPWRSSAVVSGALVSGEPVPDSAAPSRGIGASPLEPRSYRLTDSWRGDAKIVTLSYDGRGGVEAMTEPRREDERSEDERVPVELTRDTYDPLSALLALVARTAGGQACDSAVPVYDGRRRYEMRLVPRGTQEIAKTSHSVFGGPAQRCEVRQTLVAGKPWKKRVFDPEASRRTPPALLVAPLAPGSMPVPVRIEMESALGTLVVTLENVDRTVQTAELPEPAAGPAPVPQGGQD
ncbi:DUF3108 domain-containing protein [Arenibaculum pallidiluteum]|uniref:DUF3108 domain-containing protein n=1 Tax=Arenibaculum pallidiluteum TaxID=2812559 RepID=UPI001A96E34A|nr:DUF3108 domain-containing protein [Arenibaculum pallidiluteum]